MDDFDYSLIGLASGELVGRTYDSPNDARSIEHLYMYITTKTVSLSKGDLPEYLHI